MTDRVRGTTPRDEWADDTMIVSALILTVVTYTQAIAIGFSAPGGWTIAMLTVCFVAALIVKLTAPKTWIDNPDLKPEAIPRSNGTNKAFEKMLIDNELEHLDT